MNIITSKVSWLRLACAVSLCFAAACGDDSSATGGAGGAGGEAEGAGGTDGGGGAGGKANQGGDCVDDIDCSEGGSCVELAPGGHRVCSQVIIEATTCESESDYCCTSDECKAPGQCFSNETIPQCGGAPKAIYNKCLADECAEDVDCGSGICLPAGTFGSPVRVCAQAFCRSDADCGEGVCETFLASCCGRLIGFGCVEADGCNRDDDCGADAHCELNGATGKGECVAGNTKCPA